jgi:phage major head subunit gpT-like protein
MAVVTDTGLTSRAIIGRFYRRLEAHAESAWWTKLAFQFSSSQETETYRWLGMVPQVREWIGGRQIRPLRSAGVTIVNKTWEATIRVDADEQRRDKTGQVMVRINELARRVASHPNKLLTTLIESGATDVGYDGSAFFATDHSEGASGTQSNSITHDSSTPTAPTATEMYDAIVAGVTQLMRINDDAGEPLNDGAQGFLVMVPMTFLPATLAALTSNPNNATTNPLAGNDPFAVNWIANPRLSWTDKLVVFRSDGDTRPFIFQEELPVQIHALAEGSELEANENQHQYGVKAVHAAGYGFWQNACLVTLT